MPAVWSLVQLVLNIGVHSGAGKIFTAANAAWGPACACVNPPADGIDDDVKIFQPDLARSQPSDVTYDKVCGVSHPGCGARLASMGFRAGCFTPSELLL